MPITIATPPDAVLTELTNTLPRIAGSSGIAQRAPSITRSADRFTLADAMRVARAPDEIADADALPMPVYVVGLDDLAQEGHLEETARLALWSYIVTTEAGAVSAEVTSDDSQFAQISNTAAAGRARSALIHLAQDESADAPNGEAAELRVPALHLSLLWIRGESGTFEVLDFQGPELPIGRRFGADELEGVLRTLAEAYPREAEGEG
ncbi:hypothetical protein [Kocuria sp. LHG3120]|uniref:hypothetical protein n=1 Tax=Kocuria sp. LHG3120 TaxID=2804590 RepID=UPI003CEBDFF1